MERLLVQGLVGFVTVVKDEVEGLVVGYGYGLAELEALVVDACEEVEVLLELGLELGVGYGYG